MDRRRGKRKYKEREINDSSSESSLGTAARTTGTSGGGGEDGNRSADATASGSGALPVPIRGRDLAAQNAPRSAPVANQPTTGHPVGQQLAAAPGGTGPNSLPMGQQLPGLQGLELARGSGSSLPPLPPRQQRPRGLQEQRPPSPTLIANPPTEQLLRVPVRAPPQLLQGSGSRPPQPRPRVCPECLNSEFANNICVPCAVAEACKIVPPPPPPPPRQQRPQGLQEQWPPSPTNPTWIANRPTQHLFQVPPRPPLSTQDLLTGFQPTTQALSTSGKGAPLVMQAIPLCPGCRVNTSRMEHLPRSHVCICSLCISRGIACVVCSPEQAPAPATSGPPQPHHQRPPRPQQHAQHHSPIAVGAGAQQKQKQQLHHMPELAAAIFPVGECYGAPGPGQLPAAQPVLLPELQQPSQALPVPRYDKLMGFHQNPFVLGHGADPEDGRCPACRHYPAQTVLEPRRHECLCSACLADHFKCRVCHPT